MDVEGVGPLNVRASGEVDLHHGDAAFLTPRKQNIHRFDASGIAI